PVDTTARAAGPPPARLDVPKTRDEIARARHEQRDTAPHRIANTSAYDVIVRDPSPDTRVPDVVARSYERAGLPLPAAGRPRLRLEAVDNRIAYDHRVLDLGDRNVQDFTVKVFLDARDATAAAARDEVETRVTEAVDRIYNQGFRIGDRDQLNVTVEFVTRPGEAHAVVALHGTPSPTAQTAWSTHSSDLDLAHEIGHFLGLRDEYAIPGRALERALVRDDNSLMATTTPQPGNEPRLLARGVERIAGLRHDVLSPDRGALPPRTRPARFEPVRVPGGRNARFDELTGHTRDVDPGNYRQATIDLKAEAAPIGFVVNSMLPAADVDQIPEVVRAVTEGLAPGTRVAFVFGVNTTAEVPDLAFRDAVARAARLAESLDVPVAVNGYAVGTKNDKFPYGRTRNQVLRDPDTVAAIRGLAQGGPDGADRRYPYVSIQDFDRGARTVADGTHVFDRVDRATRFDPEATGQQADSPARPLMISGGYRVGDAADLVRRTRERLERRARDHEARIAELATRDDREARKELGIERQKLAAVHGGLGKLATEAGQEKFVRDFATAVDEDMRSRDRQATVHPMLPYSPEPNLFVDGLLVLGRPEVRFGDAGAEFLLLAESLHQAYGDELAVAHGAATPAGLPPDVLTTDVQVESQNNRHPDRDLGFMTDFVGAATPTDLSRLAADFAAGNFLPQSHAVPTNANRQLFYTEGTGFKEYRAELRKPDRAAGKPFAAPTDVTPRRAGVARAPGEPPRTWQESLTPEQLQQLGAQPHNRLVTTVSLPPPGSGPAPEPSGEFTVDPDLDSSKPARTVGLPTSQRLVAAHLVATSNDSGTIQQE
ncbi:sugar-binding protein, partial [Micromonospora chalcea]